MKHATSETIASIEPLIDKIRAIAGLKEKKPGIFYYKSSAFLHFHEDGDRVYADVKLVPPKFERMPVSSRNQQDKLLRKIKASVG